MKFSSEEASPVSIEGLAALQLQYKPFQRSAIKQLEILATGLTRICLWVYSNSTRRELKDLLERMNP